MHKKLKSTNSGFTLIEALVGTAIFLVVAMSVYQAYNTTMNVVRLSRVKVTATALANEQFEIMRNLPYSDIGIVNGLPVGKIPATQDLIRNGKEFLVKTTIRNIDDPFDGTIGGEPNDTSPADYKLAELEITCAACNNFSPLILTTNIAPRNLESASTNGALFVKVIDSFGEPIAGVDVHIENNEIIPNFSIDDTTNNDGVLQLVDAPPGNQSYEISVSKSGYTGDQTYTIGDPGNPTPVIPHATVLTQQLTQINFIIDQISILEVSSVSNTCTPIPNIDFSLKGSKLIGTEPDIYKYSEDNITDSEGLETIDNLDGDTYSVTFTDDEYDSAGVIPSSTFVLGSGATQNLKLIVSPKIPKSLLITVKDGVTDLPLSGVDVNITGTEYDNSLITGRGFIRQTDWSGGAGQTNYTDETKYFDSDGNIEIADPAGIIELKNILDEYVTDAWLVSSTFEVGSDSNYQQILWQPQDQPAEAGVDSIRLQIATNNDGVTWDFIGPDGTDNTYYTLANQEINSLHNSDRYLRYKVFLKTADPLVTPTVSDISFTFTAACVPPGQVFFTGLLNDSYSVQISKDGYENYAGIVDTSGDWQQEEIVINPE